MPSVRSDGYRLDPAHALPLATALEPGAIVLGTTGTDRSGLKWGFVMWSAGLLIGGLALGYYFGKKV